MPRKKPTPKSWNKLKDDAKPVDAKRFEQAVEKAVQLHRMAVMKREARELQVSELIADNARRIEALEALFSGSADSRRPRPRTA